MSLKYSHCHAGGSGSPAANVGSRSRVTAIRLACSGSSQPVAVVVRRGERVESEHRVAYAVADAAGRLLEAAGDVDRAVFPRSAIKPLQALALLESGAADRFALSEQELALACASHSGQPEHVALVRAWLARLGLDALALECGGHPPLHAE